MAASITPEAEFLLTQKGILSMGWDLRRHAYCFTFITVSGEQVLLKGLGGHVIIHDIILISEKNPDIQIIKHGLYGENMEIHITRNQAEPVVDVLNEASGEKRCSYILL